MAVNIGWGVSSSGHRKNELNIEETMCDFSHNSFVGCRGFPLPQKVGSFNNT